MANDLDKEAEWRWGATELYKESARRTKEYTPADLERSKAEADAIAKAIATLMTEGAAVEDEEVRKLVEEHRAHVDRWFYPVDHWMHARLAEMYVTDARFRANYDEIAPGLADFLAAAIEHNALQHVETVEQDSALANATEARGLVRHDDEGTDEDARVLSKQHARAEQDRKTD